MVLCANRQRYMLRLPRAALPRLFVTHQEKYSCPTDENITVVITHGLRRCDIRRYTSHRSSRRRGSSPRTRCGRARTSLAVSSSGWQRLAVIRISAYGGAHMPNSTAPLLKKVESSLLCSCSCGFPHHLAVSRVIGDVNNRKVLWYRSYQCRDKHAAREVAS